MKKIVYILAGVTLTAALMTGCGSTATNTQDTQANQSTAADNGSNKQKNFQKPDLEGEVASINGNKITLKVIKIPERPAGDDQKDSSAKNDTDKTNSDSSNKDKKASKQQNRQIEYTGETKDITLGDGIQIKTMGRGQQGSESKDLTASDIKVGDVLQITYSDKEKETISSINVRQAADKNAKNNNQ